ncbi:MAG: peptidase M48, partial [Gemmatimonadales bacterium]
YRLLGYTPAGKLQAYEKTFRTTIGSFSELKDKARLEVTPYQVELVKVDREMTVTDFNKQHPSTIPVERVAVVNGLDTPEDRIPAGTTFKCIIGGQGAAVAQKNKAPADSASGK